MKHYNVWHTHRKSYTQHMQDPLFPWKMTKEEAEEELKYLIGKDKDTDNFWEIVEMDENNRPVPLTSEKQEATMAHRDFSKIIKRVAHEANCARDNGNHTTSEMLETQIQFFQYGLVWTLPSEWKSHADQIAKEEDPEYKEYLRLKEKFK